VEQELKESQAKLDALEAEIIENKKTREALREDARVLRDKYIAEEKIRETLLQRVLSAKETN
jgi:hypothetical protein